MRARVAGGVVLSAVLAAVGIFLASRTERSSPNVILVSVDTLRPDHLGCYGYDKSTSPNLDRLSRESVLFENCYSHAPMTGPSCASFLTGFLPHETKVVWNRSVLPAGVETIAEILRAAGYATYAVVCNYVLREKQGFEQGFDVFDARMDEVELVRNLKERVAANAVTRTIEILREKRDRPFFLWLHFQDPHGPYTPPAPYDTLFRRPGAPPRALEFGRENRGAGIIPAYQRLGDHADYWHYVARYDGEIRYFDEHFGRLLSSLRELGLYDDALIIFTADHGEALGENDYYFGHGHNLDRCLIHVPLLVKHRGVHPGRRADFAQHIDIVPTILEIAGVETGAPFRGRDLLAPSAAGSMICSEFRMRLTSLIADGLKVVVDGDGGVSLYDLTVDRDEKRDLAGVAAYRGRLDRMRDELMRLRSEDLLDVQSTLEEAALTQEETERLRSLGYVD